VKNAEYFRMQTREGKNMKAIGYNQTGPITASDAPIEFEAEAPEWGG
jgi:hypothetical protein